LPRIPTIDILLEGHIFQGRKYNFILRNTLALQIETDFFRVGSHLFVRRLEGRILAFDPKLPDNIIGSDRPARRTRHLHQIIGTGKLPHRTGTDQTPCHQRHGQGHQAKQHLGQFANTFFQIHG